MEEEQPTDYLPVPMLTDDQREYVITLFARHRSHNDIRHLFLDFWGRPISPDEVMRIERDHKDRIAQVEQIEQRDIARKHLAHSAVRLEYIEQGLKEAWKDRTVGSYRGTGADGKDCWIPEEGKDLTNFRGFLDLARKEEEMQKRLYLDAIKLDLEASQVRKHTVVTVDTGDLGE